MGHDHGRRHHARRGLEPADAVFEVRSTYPGDLRQEDNEGTAKLAVRHTASGRDPIVLTVLLTPVNDRTADLPTPTFRPLAPTATNTDHDAPSAFALLGNYPNPFNPSTSIRFDLPAPAEVGVAVFDLMGRRVLDLPARTLPAGPDQKIMLDAAALASGTYLYRVTARSRGTVRTGSGRFTLLK